MSFNFHLAATSTMPQRSTKTISRLFILIFSICAAFGALANEGLYIGAKAGWVHYSEACEPHNLDCDQEDSGFGALVGYKYNDWVSTEIDYIDLGEAVAFYSEYGQNEKYVGEATAISASMKLDYTLSNDMGFFAKLGASYWDAEVKGGGTTRDDAEWSPSGGVGMQFNVANNWQARIEYQYIDSLGNSTLGGSNVHFTSAVLTYSFGK